MATPLRRVAATAVLIVVAWISRVLPAGEAGGVVEYVYTAGMVGAAVVSGEALARRAWARNRNAMEVSMEYNLKSDGRDHITLPYVPREGLVEELVHRALKG